MAHTILSDFDGVWTDQAREAELVRARFVSEGAALLGLDTAAADAEFEGLWSATLANPAENGWAPMGHITAFADEDPLIATASVASYLDRGEGGDAGGRWRAAILAGGFENAGAFAVAQFGPAMREARERHGHGLVPAAARVYAAIRASGAELVIVSNSPTEKLVALFADIGATEGPGFRLIGDARKWWIDDPAPQALAGGRRVHLGRSRYREILLEVQPDVVIGDLTSVDLALPAHLRLHGALKPELRLLLHRHATTPAWALDQAGAPQAERLLDETVSSVEALL